MYLFLVFFKTVWDLHRHSTHANIILFPLSIGFHSYSQELVCMFSSNKFFLFVINLRISSFSQVLFNFRSIQAIKHLGLTQHLLTLPTNNITILLPTLIDKESVSLEYLIDIVFKIEFQQFYPAHCQPKSSEFTVQP